MNESQDAPLAPIDYICVTREHIATGKSIPDGNGTLTINDRGWAYCSAGLTNARHEWQQTDGLDLGSIHHADLPIAPPTR